MSTSAISRCTTTLSPSRISLRWYAPEGTQRARHTPRAMTTTAPQEHDHHSATFSFDLIEARGGDCSAYTSVAFGSEPEVASDSNGIYAHFHLQAGVPRSAPWSPGVVTPITPRTVHRNPVGERRGLRAGPATEIGKKSRRTLRVDRLGDPSLLEADSTRRIPPSDRPSSVALRPSWRSLLSSLFSETRPQLVSPKQQATGGVTAEQPAMLRVPSERRDLNPEEGGSNWRRTSTGLPENDRPVLRTAREHSLSRAEGEKRATTLVRLELNGRSILRSLAAKSHTVTAARPSSWQGAWTHDPRRALLA